LPAVMKFFNGNPTLGTLSGGVGHFTGKAGLKRWHVIAEVIGRSWDDVLGAVDEIISTPDVDSATSDAAAAELAEPVEEEHVEEEEDSAADDAADEAQEAESAAESADAPEGAEKPPAAGDEVVLGGDEDFWVKVGIDPIRIMTGTGTFYTLRCYFDDRPIFLGRNGRISVFTSERALARYLADEHDHDLSDLSTYDDIRTAATDGSLRVDITDDNIYVLSGVVDDLAAGPDAVDREQLDLAVELLRDVGDYAEDNTADTALATESPLGKLVAYVLEPDSVSKPAPPYAKAVQAWEELERFVESRLRRE
ncbi:MAG TPA: primosomal protein, partial [Mycobacterium sp.]